MNYTEEQIKEIVRRVISEMPNVSLENLSNKEKNNLARNPNTPPETLARLADDEDSYVRQCVAVNPNYNKKITVTLTLTQKQLAELQKSGSYSFKLS